MNKLLTSLYPRFMTHPIFWPIDKIIIRNRDKSVKDVDIWLVLFISVMRSKILQKIIIISITTCMFTWQY